MESPGRQDRPGIWTPSHFVWVTSLVGDEGGVGEPSSTCDVNNGMPGKKVV